MKYITFYTVGFYEQVFNRYLKPSAEKFGLDLEVYSYVSQHDWGINTRIKAKLLLDALHKYGEIVWLDADSELVAPPILFEQVPKEYDMALFYLDWYKRWRGVEGQGLYELVNSVMMIRNTPQTALLLEEWIKMNDQNKVWEQKNLQHLLKAHNEVKIFSLPDSYCVILKESGEIPTYIKDPVILQHQASREVKLGKVLA